MKYFTLAILALCLQAVAAGVLNGQYIGIGESESYGAGVSSSGSYDAGFSSSGSYGASYGSSSSSQSEHSSSAGLSSSSSLGSSYDSSGAHNSGTLSASKSFGSGVVFSNGAGEERRTKTSFGGFGNSAHHGEHHSQNQGSYYILLSDGSKIYLNIKNNNIQPLPNYVIMSPEEYYFRYRKTATSGSQPPSLLPVPTSIGKSFDFERKFESSFGSHLDSSFGASAAGANTFSHSGGVTGTTLGSAGFDASRHDTSNVGYIELELPPGYRVNSDGTVNNLSGFQVDVLGKSDFCGSN